MRRFLFILASLIVLAGVVLATVPWWLGWAGPALARRAGVTVGGYTRTGYARFVATDVKIEREQVRVTVDRIEAPTPLAWLWQRWTGGGATVNAGAWSVTVSRGETKTPATVDAGWLRTRNTLNQVARELDAWLDAAEIGEGRVAWPGGKLKVAGAKWAGRELRLWGLVVAGVSADGQANFGRDGTIAVMLTAEKPGASAALKSEDNKVAGTVTVWGQTLKLDARFADAGWMPQKADLVGDALVLDGARLGVGSLYANVSGRTEVHWSAGAFQFSGEAKGTPLPEKEAPELRAEFGGRGDPSGFTLERLALKAPGAEATLDEPIAVGRDGRLRSERSHFKLAVDLANWPGSKLAGKVNGGVEVEPKEGGELPVFAAELAVSGLRAGDSGESEGKVVAELQWPRLTVKTLEMKQGEAKLSASGRYDFARKHWDDTRVAGEVPETLVARWMPAGWKFGVAKFEATIAGTWPAWKHAGRLEVGGVEHGGLRPAAVDIDWDGEGGAADFKAAWRAEGGGTFNAAGRVDTTRVEIARASVAGTDGEIMALTKPAGVAWNDGAVHAVFDFRGQQAALAADATLGRDTGKVTARAENVSAGLARLFATVPGPAWMARSVRIDGAWGDGPLAMTAEGEIGIALSEERNARISFKAKSDAEGVALEQLTAAEGAAEVLRASGRLPVVVWPQRAKKIETRPKVEMAIDVTSADNPEFWNELGRMTGVELTGPKAEIHLKGTPDAPEGRAELTIDSVAATGARWSRELPELKDVILKVNGNGGGLELQALSFQVAGQALDVTGKLPLGEGEWRGLWRDPLALARSGADLRIRIPDAELAPLARYLPRYLAPAGRLKSDVALKPGGTVTGSIELAHAASRPLGPLGALQDVSAEIAFAGRKVELKDVSARAGGQPVHISGTAELEPDGVPRLNLAMTGSNVPFVRQAGLLLRGDVDLKVVTDGDGATGISGTTRLRDSLLTADLTSLIPKGGRSAAPARRPPYFSEDVPPLNGWRLDVQVQGEQFLRIRTPLFDGTGTARFHLTGTLGEPRAIGQLSVADGKVKLPFANFQVQEGSVRLTESEPFEPRISLIGTSRRMGYDLRMELSGSAAAANLQFSSSPPLESEQVLLLVMAGEAPADEVTYSGNQRALRLGTYLAQSLLNQLGVESDSGERLTISSGEKVSRQGRETYSAEYKLNDRWSLTGEYDEFDDYNAGLKWHIFAPKDEKTGKAKTAKKEAKDE